MPTTQTTTRHALAAVLALGLGLPCSQAQAQSTAASGAATSASAAANAASAGRLARGDHAFATEAAASGLSEVMLGRLAEQHAASANVKQHGSHMVADHTKANDELKALATARGVQLPAAPTAAQQRLHDNMAKLQGDAFDRLYLATMVSDHRKAVALFEKQARTGRDPGLKEFAQKTLPTLQDHLKMTRTLHESLQPPRR